MKRLTTVFALAACMLAGSVNGQNTELESGLRVDTATAKDGWYTGGLLSLNFTQTSLTNWAAGGQSSIAGNGLISLHAHRRKGKGLWENFLDIGYGLLRQDGDSRWWKTDDKIDFTSKYGQQANDKWYYAGLVTFRTQMAPGFNYPNDSVQISNFLAPGYLLGGIGMDYKPSKSFGAYISPATVKMTFVQDQTLADAGAFGVTPATYNDLGELVTPGENLRVEFGGYLRMFFTKDIAKNVNLRTNIDLFSNYLDRPQNIDVNWETLISMEVNKYLKASIFTHLIYDHDIQIGIDDNDDGVIDRTGPRTQFKEVLGVGFAYSF